jgi:hypothetical protein
LLDRFQQFLPHLKVDPVIDGMIDCDPRDCGIDVKVNNIHCVTPLLGYLPRSPFLDRETKHCGKGLQSIGETVSALESAM